MKFKILALAWLAMASAGEYPEPCDSEIYCVGGEGSLLHTVQMAELAKDSKTFVDMPTKYTEITVLAGFKAMMDAHGQKPDQATVREFVDENFSKEGTEFIDWEPSDFNPSPTVLDKIQDSEYKALAEDVNQRWHDLGRKIDPRVAQSPKSESSLIFLQHPFIVPGGRFREMYYWDTYWTILGLLQSEIYETTKGMLQNFAELIGKLGHIPNGNRIYYNRRTQPPLFIAMVDEYYKVTKDMDLVKTLLPAMQKEFDFWIANRTKEVNVNGNNYRLARYNVEVDSPRPESYREDYRDAQNLPENERLEFYMNMKSGAESGWDYSTKWFMTKNGEISEDLTDIATRDISPVELNSYLCRNARVLASFATQTGDAAAAARYTDHFHGFRDAIDEVLWNEVDGVWYDFDFVREAQRNYFFPSNVAPLWADCHKDNAKTKEKVKAVLAYLKWSGGLDYPGGVPTSLSASGQQWDFSNAWPPLQELVITALENAGDQEASEMALDLVKKWVKNNWLSWKQSKHAIFEKYDVKRIGLPGGGGEYDVQEGFGWTNGVLLDLFSKYGDKISSDDVIPGSGSTFTRPAKALTILCLFLISWLGRH